MPQTLMKIFVITAIDEKNKKNKKPEKQQIKLN